MAINTIVSKSNKAPMLVWIALTIHEYSYCCKASILQMGLISHFTSVHDSEPSINFSFQNQLKICASGIKIRLTEEWSFLFNIFTKSLAKSKNELVVSTRFWGLSARFFCFFITRG
jgi:hypothetical protein